VDDAKYAFGLGLIIPIVIGGSWFRVGETARQGPARAVSPQGLWQKAREGPGPGLDLVSGWSIQTNASVEGAFAKLFPKGPVTLQSASAHKCTERSERIAAVGLGALLLHPRL